MPRFAANLTLMFTEVPFLDRFAQAAEAGFEAVEFLFPYEHPPEAIGERLKAHGLTQALFNLPPGDWAAGERGLAALPDRFEELKAGVETALAYARATGVKRLHLMAGMADRSDSRAQDSYRRAVGWTAERVGREGLDLVLEPINARNMPGYFLNDFDYAADLIRALALPNLKLQFDLYHCQILHGDVTMRLRALMPMVGHVQTASVPERHEPGSGEMNDAFLFAELDRLGYDGFVGCEYNPRAGTREGLGWFDAYKGARA
ncbi:MULTISPECIES: 2-oxo-tetronate isomerase [Methylobacterium]|jgi:hydroxypyruvate isomerase|uniref:2-oxo-tetronate isomerase n=1 Tax=Methylobacterium TaxID=407 RepID=UPI0008F11752|nr:MULTISPECIES: 2-oxo-tetronate isomerase [Methylobacterium]MBK3395707.1 hydroxypyruvate isomerase family protein [Methylobacterium ajmalii]MBK3408012.1 hydroxypyruvate isomerase family protein [Methylobacterium ajmalii]MBK3420672.1 hydroxypyruvate isomerase family protein [Methylobacterium ajmalii]MBZ6411164.1 hydroxypyruvate isomerase family protein [Methylobacterium sp.]SFE18510.1 hydroxypyruvate isomerase [Methylobacterium sp. yr596]